MHNTTQAEENRAQALTLAMAQHALAKTMREVLPANGKYDKRMQTALEKLDYTARWNKPEYLTPTLNAWGKGVPYDERVTLYIHMQYGDMWRLKSLEECIKENTESAERMIAHCKETAEALAALDIQAEHDKLAQAIKQRDEAQKIIDDTPYHTRALFGLTN